MRPLLACAFLCGALHSPAASAAPFTLYSTFGSPGDSYNAVGGYFLGGGSDLGSDGFAVAAMFTPSVTAPLGGIDLAAWWSHGSSSLEIDLCADLSGEPFSGWPLESFTVSGLASAPAIYFSASTLNPGLTAGTPYWLVVRVPDPVNDLSHWNVSSPLVLGTTAQREGVGAWYAFTDSSMPAFRIYGESEVPEPGTYVLTITGLAALYLVARRRSLR